MNVTYVIITLIIMTLGLLGTVLPMLPGIALIYGGFLFYGRYAISRGTQNALQQVICLIVGDDDKYKVF